MTGGTMEPFRDHLPGNHPGPKNQSFGTDTPSDMFKGMWADRALRWIQAQRDGVDTWLPDTGTAIKVEGLVSAYAIIKSVIPENGDVGRIVDFYMQPGGSSAPEHMASFLFGPPRFRLGFRLKRQHLKTKYFA